jgi:pimeloyl-ACP methyl ester carboxylesterase
LNIPKCSFLRLAMEMVIACSGIPLIIMFFYAFYMAIKVNLMESEVGEIKPDEFKLPYVPLRIPVDSSKLWLDGWFIPAANAKTTIIVGQEFKTGKSAKLKYAQFLHQAGYNVVLFDNRNYHRKNKEKALFFMVEKITEDFAAVIRLVRTIPEVVDNDIVLYVFSISTLIALNLLVKFNFGIKAVIFDSGPSASLSNMTGGYLEQFRPYIIPPYLNGPLIYPLFKRMYGMVGRFTLSGKKWPPLPDLNQIKLLFIANEDDGIVPPDQVKKIAKKYPWGEYWLAPGSRHLMAFRDHKEFYKQLVLGFINRIQATNNEVGNSKIV